MKAIEAVSDANGVTLKMFGADPIIIQRPGNVSVSEWLEFWGYKAPPSPRDGWSRPFTKEDVEGNNRRRLTAMEELRQVEDRLGLGNSEERN